LNLEGYANLEHWVAELDKRIEGILLQRLVHIIKVWCAEFDRSDDGDTRREAPVRDTFSKRRGDKRLKEEKVRFNLRLFDAILIRLFIVLGG
jgi:dynein heavy chain 1